jgi:tRNA(Ile)-lysidine synthetase-like protein
VAVSGGADSVALLRAAQAVAPSAVMALHCDHGLRGAASTADAQFVEDLCQRLGVSLFHYRAKLGQGPGLEERARNWRHRCYVHAAQASGAKRILLAHHAADQAETLLLNLVRGAGSQGAAGMRPWSPLPGKPLQLGRPFLGLMPQDLKSYLQTLRQTWREDASNGDVRLARNKVRRQVLPLLAELNAKAIEHLAAFCARLEPAGDGLAQQLKLDSAARGRVDALLAAGQGQTDLGRGWILSHGGPRTDKAWLIELKPGRPTARKLREAGAYWFSPALLTKPIQLRGAKAGERIRPFGLQGSKLVRDLLAEAKVPVSQRMAWPVLAAGGSVVAVLGIRRGQEFQAQAGEQALRLSWKAPF